MGKSLISHEIRQNFLLFYELQSKQSFEGGMINLLNKYILGTFCLPDTVPVSEQDRSLYNLGSHKLGKAVGKKENKGIKTKKKARW